MVVGGIKVNKTRETVAVSLKYGVGKMKIGSIVVRCYEFEKMLAFWQQALHVPREPAKGGWVVLRDPEGRGPNVSFAPSSGKAHRQKG